MVTRRPSNYRHPIYRRDDCFNHDTANEFRQVWRTHFRAECQAETIRQRLRSNPFFNVHDAFNSLDLNGDGRITREEFKRIIQSRGFYVSEKEVSEIVEKMDKNKDGRVSFAEVSFLFIIHQKNKLSTLFSLRTKSDPEALRDMPEIWLFEKSSKYI